MTARQGHLHWRDMQREGGDEVGLSVFLYGGSGGSHVGMVLSPFPARAGHHIAPKCSSCSGAGREETLGSLERRTGMPRATSSGTAPRALLLGGTGRAGGRASVTAKALFPQVWNQLQLPHPGQWLLSPVGCRDERGTALRKLQWAPCALCHPS